jgi:hypothetical protein
VHWTDVDSPEMVDIYFKQRLGPQFTDAPAMLISREALLKLTRGAKALLGEMIQREPDAMSDLWMPSAPPTVVGLAGFIDCRIAPGAPRLVLTF